MIIAHMFGVILLTNSVPHLVQGLCGYSFPTPFAKPRFIGLSPPQTNALWGGVNFTAGCGLLFGAGDFELGANLDTILVFLTAILVATGLARRIGALRARMEAT